MSKKNDNKSQLLIHQRLISGACAGFVDACLTHPIDMLKTRLQLGGGGSLVGTVGSIVRNEGIFAFYRGITPVVCGITPKVAVRFFAFGSFQQALPLVWSSLASSSASQPPPPVLVNFGAGLLAGITEAAVIVCPVEVVKIRLQQQIGRQGASTFALARSLLQEHGVRIFWRGLPATAARQGSQSALKFSLFHFMKRKREESAARPLLLVEQLGFGALANSAGAVLNTPLDVAKTRVQMANSQYNSLFRALTGVLKREGLGALFAGAVPRVLRIAPAGAIQFAVFEQVSRLFIASSE